MTFELFPSRFVLYIYLFSVHLTTLKVYLFVQVSKGKLISSQFVGLCSNLPPWPDDVHYAKICMDKLSRIFKWPQDSPSSGRHEHSKLCSAKREC
jgi:hypothetical protein